MVGIFFARLGFFAFKMIFFFFFFFLLDWDFFAFKMNIISIRERIVESDVVNKVTCTRQSVITRVVIRFL